MEFPDMKIADAEDSDNSLPEPIILSSASANWRELQFTYSHQPAFYIREHTPPHHTLCINTGSPIALERSVDGQAKTIDALPTGDFGFYPAYSRQSFQWDRAAEAIHLFLQPSLLNRTATELCLKDSIALEPKLVAGIDPLIQQIALALKTSLEGDGTTTQLYGDTMANALAVHLLTHYSTHNPKLHLCHSGLSKCQLKRVLDHLHDSLDREVSLAELAAMVQMSSYHFARLFKQSIGIAPHQYHIRCRVDRAKQLLCDHNLSLSEIALSVGFASQGHLNYHFKRWVGTTPTLFLRGK
jgi:AraC family transcriptional regulator